MNSFTSHHRPRLLPFSHLSADTCQHRMQAQHQKQIKPIINTDAVYTGYSIQTPLHFTSVCRQEDNCRVNRSLRNIRFVLLKQLICVSVQTCRDKRTIYF